jgi:hypothetical protein
MENNDLFIADRGESRLQGRGEIVNFISETTSLLENHIKLIIKNAQSVLFDTQAQARVVKLC